MFDNPEPIKSIKQKIKQNMFLGQSWQACWFSFNDTY